MNEYLTIAIEQEKRPVTYKLLARTLGMHVNAAKQALWEFLQTSQSAHAVYCISGKLINDDDDRYTIQLVKDNELEDAKKSFRTITGLHVYSLLPNDTKDLSVLVTASKDIPRLDLADRIKCGVIKCTTLQCQAAKKAEALPAAQKTSTSSSTTAAPKPSQLGKRNRETIAPKKQHVVEPVPSPPKPVNREAQKALESSIFSDDDDDAHMNDTAAPSRPAAVVEEEEDALQVDFMETDEPEDTPEENRSISEPRETVPPAAEPGKTMRKVMKTREFVNDRGYMTTETYEEWEEVDAPVPAVNPLTTPSPAQQDKPTPKASHKPKPGNKKKADQQQQTLTSWFTKK